MTPGACDLQTVTLPLCGHWRHYLLKNVHAATTTKNSAMIQRDESLNPVFFAMPRVLVQKPSCLQAKYAI